MDLMSAREYHSDRTCGHLLLFIQTQLLRVVVTPTEQDGVCRESSSMRLSTGDTSYQVFTRWEEMSHGSHVIGRSPGSHVIGRSPSVGGDHTTIM